MSKKYGYFYEEELDKWERLPATMLVLTSSYMGAWLLRRDERKGNRELIEALEKIWDEIRALPDINPDYPMDKTIHISRYGVQEIIYKQLAELKGEETKDCKTCFYSKNGKCAYTEECHECMWNNKWKPKGENNA